MTRISSGVRAYELCDLHLKKERIEILRIPNAIKQGKAKIENIPGSFRLNKGHVKFFYNKLQYLHKRYNELTEECILRGFNVSNFSSSFEDLPKNLYNDWQETSEARKIVVARINERLNDMRDTDIRYKGKIIRKELKF